MTRLPLVPTLVVGAAIAVMIGLGIWQLQRADWKAHLLERYTAASGRPPVAWPAVPPGGDELHFRRASGYCGEVVAWRSVSGRNRRGESGWSHIASCRTGGLEGPGMQVDIGWSRSHQPPSGWRGGEVSGTIAPDRDHRIRLVSDAAAPGLEPSAPPDPNEVPNNHLFYAFQWFFFAIAAGVIYLLALRRRRQVAAGRPSA
ncbi:SURF1 family cytochrome oxidase biogenesis protein [Allosphingosinicella sp.]|jgi:cytochrome oxidase assembly protein ShyY1|uniref:SURF1 family cytochrome oxidase biogenesis protein n=1 Tax=Allosphingosinicella sp. TaxID=2823234 RepID=UPI002F1212D1